MYQFRIEAGQRGAGKIVKVSFEQMMEAKAGFLTLPDGRTAKRVYPPSEKTSTKIDPGATPRIVSDAMGFSISAIKEFEADRVANGHTGIEFRPDPDVPEFVQVHCSSQAAKDRYMKHRAMHDRNSRNGSSAIMSDYLMDKSRELVSRKRS
jgi:hypothetical protein